MTFQKFFIGKKANSFQEAHSILKFPSGAQFVKMEQVHGNKISEITSENLKTSSPILGIDACFTTLKNTFLSVKSADCLPILVSGFGSDKHPFIAAAHAGRKSTEAKILYLLFEELNRKFDLVAALQHESRLENQLQLNIWFGPAICESCYQIDRETDTHYDLIAKNKEQVFAFFANKQLDPQKSFDLEIENHCTLHEPEKYYSYRATGQGVKMNYSFIGIL